MRQGQAPRDPEHRRQDRLLHGTPARPSPTAAVAQRYDAQAKAPTEVSSGDGALATLDGAFWRKLTERPVPGHSQSLHPPAGTEERGEVRGEGPEFPDVPALGVPPGRDRDVVAPRAARTTGGRPYRPARNDTAGSKRLRSSPNGAGGAETRVGTGIQGDGGPPRNQPSSRGPEPLPAAPRRTSTRGTGSTASRFSTSYGNWSPATSQSWEWTASRTRRRRTCSRWP
jgi:hypothetical protein